jgi:hypothetical protein
VETNEIKRIILALYHASVFRNLMFLTAFCSLRDFFAESITINDFSQLNGVLGINIHIKHTEEVIYFCIRI